jgi:regulator of protease activity HflC (stomatin/prohibitin superfamily)
MVIERMGVLHKIQEEGKFLAIPWLDKIRFCIDLRERAMGVSPSSCFTQENVPITVEGDISYAFIDAEKAAYAVQDPLYAVCSLSIPLCLSLTVSLSLSLSLSLSV